MGTRAVRMLTVTVWLRRKRRTASILLTIALTPLFVRGQQKQLTQKQAEELVLNVPAALASKRIGGCPKAFVGWVNEKQGTIYFGINDPCDKSRSASNKIGNFTVDLQNGEVWRE